MELPPLWMFYVIQCFSCTYLFFYQDCKLLKVQHCTHLPFGNDLDLLKKKKKTILKSPMDWSPCPLHPLWQMLLEDMVEW